MSRSAFWTMALGWLVRLVPQLEDRNTTLPSGPVAINGSVSQTSRRSINGPFRCRRHR